MNPLQRIVNHIRFLFTGYVGHRMKPGWRAPLPFYRVYCQKHGWYETYPMGYKGRLYCPRCREDLKRGLLGSSCDVHPGG